MKNYYISILCLLLCFSACRKDEIIDIETTDVIDDEFFMTTITGVVEDLEGLPIEGATVLAENKMTITDENGFFALEEVSAANTGTYVRVNKSGYFHSGKSIYASQSATYKTKVVLTPFEQFTTFAGGEGVEFTFQDNARLQIPPNAVSLNGTPYTGMVNVYTRWLDPTADETYLTMPGDLTAITDENERASLISFGMIAVELRTDAGEELQISEGSTATLEFPIPSDIQSEAESIIDLWHFDEEEGLWIEEGEATLVGDKYVANVSHFSWWNCDVANQTTLLCIEFVDRQGNPFTADNIYLEVFAQAFGTASVYINDQSEYCGLVPSNTNLDLTIYTLCGDLIYSQTLGPYTEAIASETVQVNDQAIDVVTVSGVLTDCGDMIVTEGYVTLVNDVESLFSLADNSGNYELDIIVCNNEQAIEFMAVDLNNFMQEEVVLDLIDGQTDYVLDVKVCGDVNVLDPLFQWTEDPSNINISSNICDSRVTVDETIIISDIGILGIDGFSTGTYQANFIPNAGGPFADGLGLTTVTITQFGGVGENIVGTFEVDNVSGVFVSVRIQ